jgi:threonine/homoserine/homoserine lactone efflux protein
MAGHWGDSLRHLIEGGKLRARAGIGEEESSMGGRLLAFIGIATIITITPGPDMALVARVAIARGRNAAWLTSCGVVSGLLVWGLASAAGIAALLNASATLYTVLRLAGAAYLIVLGVQALVARPLTPSAAAETAPRAQHGASAYGQGLLNNLLNPKIGVFYTAFLPQFIAPGQPVFLRSVLLATIHAAMGIAWLLAYATFLTQVGGVLRRPRVQRALERVTGVVLVGLGLRLATERR